MADERNTTGPGGARSWVSENGTETVTEVSGFGLGAHTGTVRYLDPDFGPVPFGFDGDVGRVVRGAVHRQVIVDIDGNTFRIDTDTDPQHHDAAEGAPPDVHTDRGDRSPAAVPANPTVVAADLTTPGGNPDPALVDETRDRRADEVPADLDERQERVQGDRAESLTEEPGLGTHDPDNTGGVTPGADADLVARSDDDGNPTTEALPGDSPASASRDDSITNTGRARKQKG